MAETLRSSLTSTQTKISEDEIEKAIPESQLTPQPSHSSLRIASVDAHPPDDRPRQSSSATGPKLEINPKRPITQDIPSKLPLQTLTAFSALCLSIFLVALDTVLIPTALPTISSDIHIADSLYAWTGSAYLLANAGSIPFWGKLSDIFGRKPVVLISNGIFLVGSIICAVSMNADMLVAGRTVQGLGGGGVVVLVHVCVSDMFAIRDRSFYMGTVGGVWAVASALGPSLGGIFAQHLSWRWCFYINLPIITVSTIAIYFTLHLVTPRTSLKRGLTEIDWLGAVTILAATSIFLVGLQYGGPKSYSSARFIALVVCGLILFGLFPLTQWWESKRGRSPIMPLRIFNDASNLSALGVCACDALVFNSIAYFLPLYFQMVLNLSPSMSGVYMLAMAIPLGLISFVSGYVIEKTGRFLEVLQAGLFFMTLGVGLLISLNLSSSRVVVLVFLVIIGLGFGPNFGAPLIALQTRIQPRDIAAGTGAFGFTRMVSGAVGVVIGQVLFQGLMKARFKDYVDFGLPMDLVQELTHGEVLSSIKAIGLLESDQKVLVYRGLIVALRGTWIFFTVTSALGLMVSFGIKRSKLRHHCSNEAEGEAVQPAAAQQETKHT